MSVLCVSIDEDALAALTLMLTRAGHAVRSVRDVDAARREWSREPALVVVLDTGVAGVEPLAEALRSEFPWVRILMMLDPGTGRLRALLPAVPKPFDAAEVAQTLGREIELARAERDRAALRRSLEHSERLASVGRIAASMAHEINNPLAVVASAVDLMQEASERDGDPDLAECSRDVALSVERIRSFVDHVCGFARREQPKLLVAPLLRAVDMALRMVKQRARARGVRVVVAGDLEVQAAHDAARLSQAILNLVSNAIDASSDGGLVTVSVTSNGSKLEIAIEDEGSGIDPAAADHLFEPFVTTKPPGEGTGLGLTITRQIVEDHGGTVMLRPRSGRGTRAAILLPRSR